MTTAPEGAVTLAVPAREALITEAPFSDRLNPVFVRELTQSLKSRVFGVSLYVSLLVIVILGIYFAGLVTQTLSDEPKGREAFEATLLVLVPIMILIVPAQAFHSTVKEVQGGAAELLFLSRITPLGLIRGKLFAALSQSLVYLSLFAPVLALTFLLRGVDVTMIVFAIGLAALASLVCSAFAVAAGTLARFRPITPLIAGITIIALGFAMMMSFGFVAFGLRALSDPATPWLEVSGVVALVTVLAVALFSVIGCAMLKHPYENRSSAIRLFVCVLILSIFGLVWWSAPARTAASNFRVAVISAISCASIFLLFASTEDKELSPRVRAQVPRNPVLALLVTPFLPGRGRGLLLSYLIILALSGVLAFGPEVVHGIKTVSGATSVTYSYPLKQFDELGRYSSALLLYSVFYCALGALLRSGMRPGTARNWIARMAWVTVSVLCLVVPAIGIVIAKSQIGNWTPIHILNPPWTFSEGLDNSAEGVRTLGILGALAGILALFTVPMVLRGVREVLVASRERRQREATPATASVATE